MKKRPSDKLMDRLEAIEADRPGLWDAFINRLNIAHEAGKKHGMTPQLKGIYEAVTAFCDNEDSFRNQLLKLSSDSDTDIINYYRKYAERSWKRQKNATARRWEAYDKNAMHKRLADAYERAKKSDPYQKADPLQDAVARQHSTASHPISTRTVRTALTRRRKGEI